MKSLVRMIGGAALALFMVGCAGDRYSRSTGQVIDDTAILTKAKAALINDPVVAGTDIDVDVNRGVVTLTGAVNGQVAKQKAQDIVAGINGVRSIQNNLLVRDDYQAVGAPAESASGTDDDKPDLDQPDHDPDNDPGDDNDPGIE